MNLYNLRSLAPNKFQMAKFDSDFNVAAVYNLEAKGGGFTCDCPANNRSVVLKPCKHKRMMLVMLGAVNTDHFYDPETRNWCQPIAVDNPDGVVAEEIEPTRAAQSEPYGSMSPTRKELLAEAHVANERMMTKIVSEPTHVVNEPKTILPPAPLVAQALPPSALAPTIRRR